MLSQGHRQYLKSLAMQSIDYGLEQGKVISVNHYIMTCLNS